MEERWVLTRKGADFARITKQFDISMVTARLMRNRDVQQDREIELYLNGTLNDLEDGMLMKDMNKAIDILKEKIELKKRIRIIGDYDIDGVNATYILLEGLEELGAWVDSDIPERIKDGYGLNIELVKRAIEDGIDTIITCDNGIAAREEIEYAKENGLTIIVTDHHEVPYEEKVNGDEFQREYLLPPADAVIDPKQKDCIYPFKELCGAGVAYKLIEALFCGMNRDPEDMDYLIENVAIATIGDVMDLVGENRIFVKQGLEMLKRTKNIGLQSLMAHTQVDVDNLKAYHIGFVIGPCINASGRLETAKRALDLLREQSKQEADFMAADLKALNDSRKELTLLGVEEAVKQVEDYWADDRVLVVYLPNCHESLAGIIAGRIRERYYKPTFVLTNGERGIKGSGRSIEDYHMFDELTKCKELFSRYGGHPIAAGVSLKDGDVDKFRRTMNQLCQLTEEELTPKSHIDVEAPISYWTEDMIEELSVLEPFGKGNAKPKFAARDVEITSFKVVGANHNVLQFQMQDQTGRVMKGITFNNVEEYSEKIIEKYGEAALNSIKSGRRCGVRVSVLYYPQINEYNGYKNIQILVDGIK